MEKYNFTKLCNSLTLVLTVLSLISLLQPTLAAKTPPAAYTKFIKTKCSATTYPTVCIKTLNPFASYIKTNSLRLCNTALNIAIQGARNASTTVSKLKSKKGISRYEAAALKDCIYDLKDAIYELKKTLKAMKHLKGADRDLEWANAKTWASAAISDAESCMDGFTDRKVNPTVKKTINSIIVAQEKLISNSLALINRLFK